MLIRGEIIIPHVSTFISLWAWWTCIYWHFKQHYEFYYFIANKVPSFSNANSLLFDYSNKAPPAKTDPSSPPRNEELEGGDGDPTLTKVVDRRWYERNKHIFPASLWREYEPGEEFIKKMRLTRRDAQGNIFFFWCSMVETLLDSSENTNSSLWTKYYAPWSDTVGIIIIWRESLNIARMH
jgi:protein FAM50